MSREYPSIRFIHVLLMGFMVLLFSASCTKKDHDCAQPATTTTTTGSTRGADMNATSRNSGGSDGDPANMTLRGGVSGSGGDQGTGGISDDGDDQSDNERSHKKPKLN